MRVRRPVAARGGGVAHAWPGFTPSDTASPFAWVMTPLRHHVGAIADPRRVMADGRGGDAEFLR